MLSAKKHPYYVFSVVAVDSLAIIVSFCLAYAIRFSGILIPLHKGVPDFENYFRTAIIVVPIYLYFFRWNRLYQPGRHIRRIQELLTVFKAVSIATVVLMALTFIYREFSYSRALLLIAWFLGCIFCCMGRYFLIQFEYFIRKTRNRDRVLVIGMSPAVSDLIRWAKANPHYGQDVIGILSNNGAKYKNIEGVPILGSIQDFDQLADVQKVDEVILADPTLSRHDTTELILKCESKMIRFKLVADLYGLATHHVDVEYVSNVPLLGLRSLPLDDVWNRILKRTFDFVVSFSFLIVFAPVFLIIGFLSALTSRGPIFYKQERIGQDGKVFKLYKFRTMNVNAEHQTGPVWAKAGDQRVTKLGKILRRTNLDELPQLWNVLRGNMSLVGPRPERPHFVEQFRDQIPRYMARHKIKSGLTGWAQIHGLRGDTSIEERIKYDLYYMENWTLMMDIEILLATPFAFKNAY